MDPGANIAAGAVDSVEKGESIERGVCFPCDALATLADGTRIRMDHLQTGDVVIGRYGSRTRVIAMSHADRHAFTTFLLLHTASGADIILTSTHYIQSGSKLVQAGNIRVNDSLELLSGKPTPVTHIRRTLRSGLYSPITDSGYIAISDSGMSVVASCFTNAVAPHVASALASPLRWAARIMRFTVPFMTSWLEKGSQFWTSHLPRGNSAVYNDRLDPY